MNQPDSPPECGFNSPSSEAPAPSFLGSFLPNDSWLSAGSAVIEPGGRLLAINDALAGWLGDTPAALKGEPLSKLLGQRHPEWEYLLESFLKRAEGFDRLELSSSAEGRLERLSVELACHGNQRFLHIESIMPPVPELEELFPESCWGRLASHRAFQRMLRSETQLDNLMNRWPGIMFSQRPDFSFIFVSPKIEELTGISATEFRRQSKYFWEVVHEADAEALAARLRL